MNVNERKTVDMLTKDSVSILTQQFIELDGIKTQVGENHRIAYCNSKGSRELLAKEQPPEVRDAVFTIWGDTPTINEETEPTGQENVDIKGVKEENN